jgi:hypothetical protein
MAKKQRPSFQKRQKEMARQQKQKEKEARRAERKLQRETGVVTEETFEVLDGPPDYSDEQDREADSAAGPEDRG